MSSVVRPVLRQSLLRPSMIVRRAAPRRLQSTAPSSAAEAAAKARQAAADVTAKATQGLSRVSSAAGPVIASAARNVSGALGRVGGPVGRLVAFVERQTPIVIYYSRVGLELSRLVFQGQKMTPPSLDVFQSYFQNVWKQLQDPAKLYQIAATWPLKARSLTRAQLATGGVLVAELLGFFTVGEMIGRFKLIGYHGETGHHH